MLALNSLIMAVLLKLLVQVEPLMNFVTVLLEMEEVPGAVEALPAGSKRALSASPGRGHLRSLG